MPKVIKRTKLLLARYKGGVIRMWWLFGTGTWLPMSGSAVFATRTGILLKILFYSEFYFTTNKIKTQLNH